MHFKNQSQKIKTILSVFKKGEKSSRDEIAQRLHNLGFEVSPRHLSYYIKDYMAAFIDKEEKKDAVLYFLKDGVENSELLNNERETNNKNAPQNFAEADGARRQAS